MLGVVAPSEPLDVVEAGDCCPGQLGSANRAKSFSPTTAATGTEAGTLGATAFA